MSSGKEGKEPSVTRRQLIAAAAAGVVGLAVGAAVGSQAFPRKVTETVTERVTTTVTTTVTAPVTTTVTERITVTQPVPQPVPVRLQELPPFHYEIRLHPHLCGRCCEAYCCYYIVVAVDKRTGVEKAITLKGRPEDPVARGKYCVKGLAFVDSLYDPDRLLVAVKRTNPKKGIEEDPGWAAIPYTQALSEIIEKLKKYKPEEVYIGSPGDPFTNRLALSLGWRRGDQRTECFGLNYYISGLMLTNPPNKYHSSTYTPSHVMYGYDYDEAKSMVTFGFDSFSKCGKAGVINHFVTGKRRGARIVSFNPVRTPLTDIADEWYPVKPGTDLAIALAMIRTILYEKLYNEEFLKNYTDAPSLIDVETRRRILDEKGQWLAWCTVHNTAEPIHQCHAPALLGGPFEVTVGGKRYKAKPVLQLLYEKVRDYTPEWASKISEVPAEAIARITREHAKAAPYCFIATIKRDAPGANYANSWRLKQALLTIEALLGTIDHEGGVLLFRGPKVPWLEDISPPPKPFPPQPPVSPDCRHMFPILEGWYLKRDFVAPGVYGLLAYGLLTGVAPTKVIFFRNPYRGLYALIGMPAVEEALKRMELVVTWDTYLHDLSYFSDYVLPGTHQFEEARVELRLYYPKWRALVGADPIRSPPGEARGWGATAMAIGRALAKDYWEVEGKPIYTDMRTEAVKALGFKDWKDFMEKTKGVWVEKERKDYQAIREIGYGPDGRVRLYIDDLLDVGFDPLPEWWPRWTEPEGEYKFSLVLQRAPWLLMADPAVNNNAVLRWLSEQNYIDRVWINPEAAKELGLSEGDEVIVEPNPKYFEVYPPRPIRAKVHISERVARKDVIMVFHGLGVRSRYLRYYGYGWGPRDGDIIPVKRPEVVKAKDPFAMGWLCDVYVRIRKAS